jgi:protein arginine N-methyltransferase 1
MTGSDVFAPSTKSVHRDNLCVRQSASNGPLDTFLIGRTIPVFHMDAADTYSLRNYGEIIADRVRTGSYAQALRKTVKPGCVVLEIGTGPGVFAILACQLGAGRVIAIESAAIIQVARENAAINGCTDRIEFIEGFSTDVTLNAQADVIVSDLHGVLPLYGRHIPSIMDARRRFLRPGGAVIPREEKIWAALVEMPKLYSGIVEPWEHNVLDQDLAAGRRLAVNGGRKVRAKPEHLLTAPQLWATLDYSTIESPDVHGELQWTIERAATGHGILLWFDCDLADDVSFSNSPAAPEVIFGSLLFPWIHPAPLSVGETVCVQMEAKLTGSDYEWRWTTQIRPPDSSGEVREQFDQSTLAGTVMSPARLRKMVSGYVPRLSDECQLDRRILEMMDGQTTLEEISRRLAAEYPNRFPRWQDALTSVIPLSRKYSR